MSEWTSRLRQASFRGVPFGVLTNDRTVGRRISVHEYPGRDDPFPEDLGRATRRVSFRGFLIENSIAYRGGPLDAQCAAMEAAAEAKGPGELVHPTRGRFTVSVERLVLTERSEAGRYVELSFELVIGGVFVFGLPLLDTASGVLEAADLALSSLSAIFGANADGYVGSSAALGNIASVSSLFSGSALSLGSGVSGVFSLGADGSAGASAELSAASASFLSASSGLGVLHGAGVATATAASKLTQAASGLTGTGAAIDSMGALADAFGGF